VPESLLTILKLAFLALLWLFFLRVLRAVWAQLKEPAAMTAAPAAGAAAAPATTSRRAGRDSKSAAAGLKVVEPPEEAGRVFTLGNDMTLGRGAGCGIPLTSDRMVSQLHARIYRGPAGEVLVEDLGSTNGTTLNRNRVTGPTRLSKGDRLQVGRTVLEVTS
jgi:pSer/pThr/pTyr-binding forkhead associated (FHA) protein